MCNAKEALASPLRIELEEDHHSCIRTICILSGADQCAILIREAYTFFRILRMYGLCFKKMYDNKRDVDLIIATWHVDAQKLRFRFPPNHRQKRIIEFQLHKVNELLSCWYLISSYRFVAIIYLILLSKLYFTCDLNLYNVTLERLIFKYVYVLHK